MTGARTGLRIIDSTHLAGPFGAVFLADTGAGVIDDILRRPGHDAATIATYRAAGVV